MNKSLLFVVLLMSEQSDVKLCVKSWGDFLVDVYNDYSFGVKHCCPFFIDVCFPACWPPTLMQIHILLMPSFKIPVVLSCYPRVTERGYRRRNERRVQSVMAHGWDVRE